MPESNGQERVYFSLHVIVYHWGKPRQEVKGGSRSRNQQRNPSFWLIPCGAFTHLSPTAQVHLRGTALHTAGWALLYQSLRTASQTLTTGQYDPATSSTEAPFPRRRWAVSSWQLLLTLTHVTVTASLDRYIEISTRFCLLFGPWLIRFQLCIQTTVITFLPS